MARVRGRRQSTGVDAHTAIESTFHELSEETRVYLSAAGLKASFEAASSNGAELLSKAKSLAMPNTARTADVVHGWSAARQQPTVQAVQVVLPTAEMGAERRRLDDKLDEITRFLKE